MVDLYTLHVMAAPSDPFPHDDLQQQHRTANPNPNPKSNHNTWGTWEELLLASAVRKHGPDNWALISAELRSRVRAGSMAFTPEACQAGYQAIRLRYGADESREGNGMVWYEELRRLRVARLKWELEQYDNSIGSLENKIKRLQVEKEELARRKSSISHVGAQEPTTTCTPRTTCSSASACVVTESIDASMIHKAELHEDACIVGNDGPVTKQEDHDPSWPAEPAQAPRSDGFKSGVEHASLVFGVQNGGEALGVRHKHTVVVETVLVKELRQDPGGSSVKLEQAVGDDESSIMAEVLPNAINGNQLHENIDKLSSRPLEQSILGESNYGEATRAKSGNPDVLQGDLLPKVEGFLAGSKAVKAGECKNMEEGKAIDSKDAQGGVEESESPCSPMKGKRTFDEAFRNSSQDDVDDKRLVCKALDDKSSRELKGIVLVESGDSTEGKGQEEKVLSKEPSSKKIKLERLVENIPERVPPMGSLASSRKLGDVPWGSLNRDMQNHSMSSSENSLHEVWGESAEVGDKEEKPINKKRRLVCRDRKHTSTMKHHEGTRDEPSYSRQLEPPLEVEYTSTSHEASESMHSPSDKDDHVEAWHQAERLSGDSRFEKSEVGSYVDGNEDNSPMSRRSRREPKVLGKHIPLLESLRVVCAHKCAPTFRHIPEMEENHTYHYLIRSPIDLGMIRNKLEEGQYSGSVHFFRDLLLMVSNALVYYPRDLPESAAASGLRECIVKEMGKVFETEALVKQEGPSFRRRESRQLNQRKREGPKASSTTTRLSKETPVQALLATEKEKPVKASPPIEKPPNTSVMEKPAKSLVLKHLGASTSVDSRTLFHSSPAAQAQADKGVLDKQKVYSFDGKDPDKKKVYSSDGKRALENPLSFKGSHSSKLGPAVPEKASEARHHHPGPSTKALNSITISKDSKKKERMAEGIERERKTDFPSARTKGERRAESAVKVGGTSEAPIAMNKGVESVGRKVKAASESWQEPVKRGVGRPPKHSRQQQGGPKEGEAPQSTTRKRGRR